MERKTGAFGFDVRDDKGHLLQTDSSITNGGNEMGFRPMQLLLAALGSCSAIDMISILQKQRQEIHQFHIKIEGEREQDKVPSLWKNISVFFTLKGKLEQDKVERQPRSPSKNIVR